MSEEYRSGFVAIVGRPNVGKSTLMNRLVGEKIAIISDKPQTTRNRIQCVLTRPDYQIIFIDTPGIHKPKNRLGEYMVKIAQDTFNEVDVVLLVVDVAEGIGGGDRYIINTLNDSGAPVVLALNKIDRASSSQVEEAVGKLQQLREFQHTIKISAAMGTNLEELEEVLLSYLPQGPKYYPDDMITDQPERVIIAELIREKALRLLNEEVPHGIGVEVLMIKEREDKDIIDIDANILCERSSHKAIIIGKGGRMIQNIGTTARQDIEGLLGVQVNLQLWVKVKGDWRNNPSEIRNLGYD